MAITRPIITAVTLARLLFVKNVYAAPVANPWNCLVAYPRSHTRCDDLIPGMAL